MTSTAKKIEKSSRYSLGKMQKIAEKGMVNGVLCCGICNKPINKGWNVDHIIPKSKGGSSELSNLQPTHYKCNHAKDDIKLSEYAEN